MVCFWGGGYRSVTYSRASGCVGAPAVLQPEAVQLPFLELVPDPHDPMQPTTQEGGRKGGEVGQKEQIQHTSEFRGSYYFSRVGSG